MRSTATRILCTAALLLALPAVAHAGGPSPSPSPETVVMTDKARQLYEEGLAAIQKSKWLEARASLLAAWSLLKHWQIAANLAGCELELAKFRDAAEHAAFYLHNAPADRRAKAELVLNRAKQNIGTLTVDAQPPGAEVQLDGALVGQVPLHEAVFVDPGEHVVLVRAPGLPDATQRVVLAAGEAKTIALTATEAPPPPLPPPPKEGWRPGVGVLATGGVLAAGGLAVGIGLTAAANGKGASRAAALGMLGSSGCAHPTGTGTSQCAALLNEANSQSTLANGAVAGFVVGGALAAATAGFAVWAIRKRAPQDSARIQVTPVLDATGRGVVVSGQW